MAQEVARVGRQPGRDRYVAVQGLPQLAAVSCRGSPPEGQTLSWGYPVTRFTALLDRLDGDVIEAIDELPEATSNQRSVRSWRVIGSGAEGAPPGIGPDSPGWSPPTVLAGRSCCGLRDEGWRAVRFLGLAGPNNKITCHDDLPWHLTGPKQYGACLPQAGERVTIPRRCSPAWRRNWPHVSFSRASPRRPPSARDHCRRHGRYDESAALLGLLHTAACAA